MLITVSGPPGSGKSTAAAGLADELGVEHISGGDIFRELAAERDYTLSEFNALAEQDEEIDRDLDQRLHSIAMERNEVVLESRLAGWLAGDHADIRMWLDAPLAVRTERIATRENEPVEVIREATTERAESEAARYQKYYDIDIEDRSIYDLVVNTARWDEPDVVRLMAVAVETYNPAADEGKQPIEGIHLPF